MAGPRVGSARGPLPDSRQPLAAQDGPRWSDPYYLEWAITVGDRIRRLRRARDWALHDLAARVPKPEGGHFSTGYFSRLERGWGSAPLYTYVKVAEAFDVQPGRLLGPEEVQREVTPDQSMLLRVLERAGIDPADAIVRLTSYRICTSALSPTTKR